MTRSISRTAFMTVCFTLLCMCNSISAHAQACSLSQVAGKWAFWTQGNVNGIGPRVSAGVFTLDTGGNLVKGKATSSLAGTVAPETFSGTYSVDADCTGEFSINVYGASGSELFTASLAIYFDDGGKEVRGIFTTVVAQPSGTPLLSEILVEARKINTE